MRNSNGTASRQNTTIRGHGKEDTFVDLKSAPHMMKSIIVNDVGSGHYGDGSLSAFRVKNSQPLDTVDLGSGAKSFNSYFPIDLDSAGHFGDTSSSSSLISEHTIRLFDMLHGPLGEPDSNAPTGSECLYNLFLPVFLDRFDVEKGGS